jgi:putative FmdB family regulatory protein
MPTYEYICRACGHAFEQFQNMSADPTRECPDCGKHEVERLISSGGGIVFKGSGFYATDYRKEAPKKTKPDAASSTGSSGGGEGSGSSDGGSTSTKSGGEGGSSSGAGDS